MARNKEAERIRATKIRRQQVHAKNDGRCAHCGRSLEIGDDFSIDHIIPLSKGGTNDFRNLIPLCKECNKEKDDDVLDADYYICVSKVISEEIAQLMSDYYEDKDWLTEDNIFRNDRFKVDVVRTIRLKNGKIYQKPAVCEFRKLKEDEFEKIMEEYIEDVSFSFEGADLPEDITGEIVSVPVGTPYRAVFDGKTICTVCCSLTAGTGGGIGIEGRAMLRLLLAVSPDIKFGPSSKFIIDSILDAVVEKTVESLEFKGTKGLALCCIDALISDKRSVDIISLRERVRDTPLSVLRDAETNEPVYLRSYSVLAFGGVDVPKEGLSFDDFIKQEKLYSGQLRRRMSRNSKGK